MAQTPLTATIVGIPHIPSITEVNVRNDPSTQNDFIFKMPVGTTNLPVLEAAPDSTGNNLNGKTYQWLRMQFSNGRDGWIRDDLIEIVGDGTSLGYPVLTTPILGFNLTRKEVIAQPSTPEPTPTPDTTSSDSSNPFVANLIGIPNIPSITEVNVRDDASSTSDIAFKLAVGTANLTITDVKEDTNRASLNFKIYQWMRIQTSDSREGYVRDDLIEVKGDGSSFGYGVVNNFTVGYNLTRGEAKQAETTPVVTPPETVTEPVETPKVTQPVSSPTGEATAISMNKTGVNMRSGAGTNNSIVTRFQYRDTATILDQAQGQDGKDFLWVKLRYKGTDAWVREDFLRYRGDFGKIGLSAPDLYPCPVPDAWWIRDFDRDGSRIGVSHHGWDHAGNKGFKIMAGPKGGTVVRDEFCQMCGSQGASAVDRGFSLSDSRVLGNQGWNFGYGHFIIVRYDHDMLPDTAKTELASRNFAGAHLFVMYAHLQDMLVRAGDTVSANQQIATLGNSGNSSGPHLHLEVRASTDPNAQWSRIIGGLMTPGVLFLR